MIAIIDYGVGNLFSLRSSLAYLGLESKITGDPEEIRKADRIILPGVGAFGDAMQKLVDTGLVPLIREEVQKKPLLGISLKIVKDDPLFQYVKDGEYVYYVHSFYGKDCEASTLATSEYGLSVTGVVRQGLVWGTQFHPEKSGDTGLRLLKAFGEL